MKSITKSFQYGEHQVTIETGAIARQADGAVLVDMAETTVLVTAVGRKSADPGRDFFPLTVNYQEKTYAAGKIPGGFFKREGRPMFSARSFSKSAALISHKRQSSSASAT